MIDPSMKTAIEEAGHARTAGTGRIVRIIGAVVDVQFPAAVPGIYNALTVEADTPMGHVSTILEVESQQPGGIARCVAMTSTDGLQRGLTAVDTGEPMKMPVGPETLGRIWNVLGQPVDGKPMPEVEDYYPIHHPAPHFDELTTQTEIFETGIKAVDLLEPYIRGGKTGPLRRRRRGQDGAHPGAHQQPRPGAQRHLGLHGRGRAHPRGYRPLSRDDGIRRYRQNVPRVRSDERAPGSTPARGPRRPHRGGVLP